LGKKTNLSQSQEREGTKIEEESMIAQPVQLQDKRLKAYLRLFSTVFSLPQWKYFVTILLGLLHCDERRTLSALLRSLAVKMTIFGLCYFLRKASGSVDELAVVRQRQFYQMTTPDVEANHARQRAEQVGKVGGYPLGAKATLF
jgi:hypothetical protein